MVPCASRRLEDPALKGAMLGLKFGEESLEIDPQVFPCCKGAGCYEHHHALHVCHLKERYSHAKVLAESFDEHWQGKSSSQVADLFRNAQAADLQHKIAAILKGDAPQCLIMETTSGRPGHIWTVALICLWRFGIPLSFHHRGGLNGKLEFGSSGSDGPMIICAEYVDRLWDADIVDQFEAICDLAYKTNSFLMIEWVRRPEESKPQSRSRWNLESRVADIKARHPWSFLGDDCKSQLRHLCAYPRSVDLL